MWLQLKQNVFCWKCTRSSCSSTSCAGSWSGKEDRRADQYCVIMHCHFTRDIWCVSAICCFPFDSTQQRKLAFWIIPPTFLWFFFALFRFSVSILLFPHLSLFSLFLCRICYLCPFFISFLFLFCSFFSTFSRTGRMNWHWQSWKEKDSGDGIQLNCGIGFLFKTSNLLLFCQFIALLLYNVCIYMVIVYRASYENYCCAL